MPHAAVPENKLAKPRRRKGNDYQTAVLLSILLDEPQDNPDNPHPVRIEQAQRLLSLWSSAQGSLVAALREAVNLKQGYCIRCDLEPGQTAPCKDCGRKPPEPRGF